MTEDRVNVLLVDDQPEGLLALEAILQGLGQNLFKAKSGREALKHVLETEFALILLDIEMPEMDGYETAEAIRRRERSGHTPIIFLTAAYLKEVHVFQGYATGAVDYMFKPVEPEILRSKVRVFVDLAKRAEEVKRLNVVLERKASELATANKELEAFAYSASHDLRAPLRHIEGFSRMLQEKCGEGLNPVGRDYLAKIGGAANRMSELIKDLLVLSRIGRTEVRRSPVDLCALARTLVEDLRKTGPERDVEFSIADLPLANADPGLVRIVLENLLGNAWKYTGKRSGARIEVGTMPDADGKRVYFVRDNGAGFDARYADKLFSPFQRLHSDSEFDGTGIGLATVFRVVQRHDGRIWAEGEVNEGATFYFTLE